MIRLVISSYFIAISLGIISGVNPGLLFEQWFTPTEAYFIGGSLMVGCSLFIFCGLFLRLSCLYLALLVLMSTLVENALPGGAINPDALWRDIVFVCVLLLIYGSLSDHLIARTALVRRPHETRKLTATQRVTPRRVLPHRDLHVARTLPSAAPEGTNVIDMEPVRADRAEPDINNIFSDTERAVI